MVTLEQLQKQGGERRRGDEREGVAGVAAHAQIDLDVPLGVEEKGAAGVAGRQPLDLVAEQAVQEARGIRSLHPHERGATARHRRGTGAQQGVSGVDPRGRGRGSHGVLTLPLVPARWAARRACSLSLSAAAKSSVSIERRRASSRVSSSSCLEAAGMSKAAATA